MFDLNPWIVLRSQLRAQLLQPPFWQTATLMVTGAGALIAVALLQGSARSVFSYLVAHSLILSVSWASVRLTAPDMQPKRVASVGEWERYGGVSRLGAVLGQSMATAGLAFLLTVLILPYSLLLYYAGGISGIRFLALLGVNWLAATSLGWICLFWANVLRSPGTMQFVVWLCYVVALFLTSRTAAPLYFHLGFHLILMAISIGLLVDLTVDIMGRIFR